MLLLVVLWEIIDYQSYITNPGRPLKAALIEAERISTVLKWPVDLRRCRAQIRLKR